MIGRRGMQALIRMCMVGCFFCWLPSPFLTAATAGQQLIAEEDDRGRSFTDPTTGMEFVYVPGGCFQMGNPVLEKASSGGGFFWYLQMGGNSGQLEKDEKPDHEVCVDGFYMGKYEVTQKEYKQIIGKNPSIFHGDRNPVEQVSWHDAQAFIGRLAHLSGRDYRLPTEAEWEYAARSGGKSEKYAGGDDIDAFAWYDEIQAKGTRPVGGKRPNGLGLYDMSGNVWEWCNDWYAKEYYSVSPKRNPSGPSSGENRVFRGGAWNSFPYLTRTMKRRALAPNTRNFSIGFRLVFNR
jgi:formylglycine-generating enzyme required for sulfatase activity